MPFNTVTKARTSARRWRRAAASAGAVLALVALAPAAKADDPLVLARDGYFYVGGRVVNIGTKNFVTDQMYVEVRIPAKQTQRYPI